MEITVTEKEQGKLSEKNLDLACQKLSETGYVIFVEINEIKNPQNCISSPICEPIIVRSDAVLLEN